VSHWGYEARVTKKIGISQSQSRLSLDGRGFASTENQTNRKTVKGVEKLKNGGKHDGR